MSWKDNPKIRQLEPYAKEHGYLTIVLMAVHENWDQYEITTYGRTASLCKTASLAGDQLDDLVQRGKWPTWPREMPSFTRADAREAELRRLRGVLEDIACGGPIEQPWKVPQDVRDYARAALAETKEKP